MKNRVTTSTPSMEEDLAALGAGELRDLHAEFTARLESLQRWDGRKHLVGAILRRRAAGLAADTFGPVRLDRRLEKLFESLRASTDPWPVEDAMRVIDGVVARLVSRRIWMGLVALLTIVPAIVSLLLLAAQNRDLHETMRVEDESQYRTTVTALRNTLHGESSLSLVRRIGGGSDEFVPAFHKRLRAEAFGTLIAMEKRRWSKEERSAVPATRYVDMRDSHFSNLVLGSRIGLDLELPRNDYSRIAFDGSGLSGASFLSAGLEDCRFDRIDGRGATFATRALDRARFRGADLREARFHSDGKTEESCLLTATDFSGADLRGASFSDCFFVGAIFTGAKLGEIRLEGVRFKSCDLSDADLGEAPDWTDAIFNEVVFTADQVAALRLAGGHEILEEKEGKVRVILNPDEYFRWLEGEGRGR